MEAVTRHWRHWLRGRKFILRSDHGALKELLTKKGENFSNRQFRWFERLQDFSFEFQHIAGSLNTAADTLSRDPVYFVSALELRRKEKIMKDLGWEELKTAANRDEEYQRWVGEKKHQKDGHLQWYREEEGLLFDFRGRLAVPHSEIIRTKIILEAHETPFCGHLGTAKTTEAVARIWWWDTLTRDVKNVVTACDVCQRAAGRSRKQEAPITPIVASRPWEMVTMDFVSGFAPSTPGGWKGCVVICDRFSRMIHIRECSTHPTAKEAAKLFIAMVIRAHGTPRTILTDRGTQFESILWFEVMEMLGSRVSLASTHHPQSNGLTERMNRTLIAMIKRTCHKEHAGWVEALPLLEFAYNNSIHRATGVAPFEVCNGNRPVVPAALLVPEDIESSQFLSPSSYAAVTKARLQRIQEQVRKAEEQEQQEVKRREDAKRGNPIFQPGDEVLCRQFSRGQAEGKSKQEFSYHGPYLVSQVLGGGSAVKLSGLSGGMPLVINVEYLRKYRRHTASAQVTQNPVPPPALLGRSGQAEWEVEEILQHRMRRGRREYLVKWKGYPQATWQPQKDLENCQRLMRQYWRRAPTSPFGRTPFQR